MRLACLTGIILACSTGCQQLDRISSTKIGTILKEPRRFAGQPVKIAGTATGSFSVLSFGGFQVDDGTGTILVISNHTAPPKGGWLVVRGTVEQGFAIGERQLLVIIEGPAGGSGAVRPQKPASPG